MNDVFNVAKEILINIIENNIPFSLAIKNTFKKAKIEKDKSRDISALVGCELRHHLLFTYLLKKYFGDIPLTNSVGVLFLISNILFLKRFNEEELKEFALLNLKDNKNIDISKLDELIKNVSNSNQLIPEEIINGSDEYLSLRFNTPLWIVKMWTKQYGKGVCIKMLKTNYKPLIMTVGVNPFVTTEDTILATSSDFRKTLVPGILSYEGKVPVKKTSLFENGSIYYEKEATKVIIDSLDIEPVRKIAIYCAFSNNIYMDLMSRFGKNVEIDIINSNTQSYFESKKAISLLGLNKINIFDESFGEIYTCISTPADVFFVLPRNSMLDLLRSTPDYFIKFKQESLDEIILEEKETLNNASKRVEVDGKLIYMIPTLSKKEGHLLIKEFLYQHDDFILLEEKQFYPFESLDSCLYYANLKKIK